MAPLRWGIVSAGTISHDFVNALTTLPATDHTVVCVGARGLKSAQKFAELHEIPNAYEGYEAIAKDPNVGEWMFYKIRTKVLCLLLCDLTRKNSEMKMQFCDWWRHKNRFFDENWWIYKIKWNWFTFCQFIYLLLTIRQESFSFGVFWLSRVPSAFYWFVSVLSCLWWKSSFVALYCQFIEKYNNFWFLYGKCQYPRSFSY